MKTIFQTSPHLLIVPKQLTISYLALLIIALVLLCRVAWTSIATLPLLCDGTLLSSPKMSRIRRASFLSHSQKKNVTAKLASTLRLSSCLKGAIISLTSTSHTSQLRVDTCRASLVCRKRILPPLVSFNELSISYIIIRKPISVLIFYVLVR